MSEELSQVQNNLIREIALREGFKNYELIVTSGSKKGDGFLGIIASVTIQGDKGKLNLILKSAHVSEVIRTKAPIVEAYHREIFLYEKVFPAFRELEADYNISDGFRGYAKIYGSSEIEYNECVILENLKEMNYRLWNKRVPMNSEHLSLVMVEYGKLHGTSLALKNCKPEVYIELTETLEELFNTGSDKVMWKHATKSVVEKGLKAVSGNSFATEAMKKFLANVENFYYEAFEVPEDRIVILHGDCWNNNMMFKYEDSEDTSKPKRVCLLDWQLSRTGSPALDLAYFLYVCASKVDLAQYRKYLKIYHNALSDVLRKFSCNIETVLLFNLLESHWKKYSRFGVCMAMLIIKIMLSDEDEIPNLEDIGENKNNMEEQNSLEFSHENEYNQRIVDILTVMSENGLI